MGRRVKKSVYVYESSAFSLQSTYLYIYDGWNLIEELDDSQTVQKAYIWGLDLSQSMQDAGGVGGLVAAVDDGATYLYSYDGNGNVGQVTDAADGSVDAHYEYDPFGNLLNQDGIYADENVYRFSTKYFDQENSLYYYGYRYYSPELGRWINRDPIGEEGGYNIYTFVKNSPEDMVDILGLDFIALAARELAFLDGEGRSLILNHLSIEYWESRCPAGVGNEHMTDDFQQNHPDAVLSGSIELLVDGLHNWAVWVRNRRGYDGRYYNRTQWSIKIVSVSVIHYNTSTGNRFSAFYEPINQQGGAVDNMAVAAMWRFLRREAQTYDYAEQAGPNGFFDGNFRNWPNSRYFLPPGNNSNSFARWVVTQSGEPIPDLYGVFPGNHLPEPVNLGGNWSTKDPVEERNINTYPNYIP